jgi:hypothetical protein
MKQNCSELLIDAERKCIRKNVEVNRKKTLKSSNIKHIKLPVNYFFEKVINKHQTAIIFLKVHAYH